LLVNEGLAARRQTAEVQAAAVLKNPEAVKSLLQLIGATGDDPPATL
jgi:hypothetical protein